MKSITAKIMMKSFVRVCILVSWGVMAAGSFGCNGDREPTAPVETVRPIYTGNEPENGKLVIPVSQVIRLAFTEKMKLETFPSHFILKDASGNIVDGAFSILDSVVLFTPKQALQKATVYYTELRGRLRDSNNNSIELNGDAILNDTTLIYSGWFYTEGDYSAGGFNNLYIRDRKAGNISILQNFDTVVKMNDALTAPQGMALSSDGKYIIVSNTSNNQIDFISTANNNVEKRLDVALSPSSIVVIDDYAYVICADAKSICKIKVSTKTVENTYAQSFFPAKLAASADGSILYTFDQQKRDLYLINAADGKVIKKLTAAVDKMVSGEIKYDKFSDKLYVCDSKGFKLKVIDKNGTAVSTVITYQAQDDPNDIVFDDKYFYVAAGKSIIKYDKATNTIVKSTAFATKVKSLAVVPSGDIVYGMLATSISIIDNASFVVLKNTDLASSGIESMIVSQIKL